MFRLFWVALAGATLAMMPAQAKANFSGNWKLNPGKSNFGAMPAPAKRTDKIVQRGATLTDSYTQSGRQGDVTAEMKYSTDGKETTSDLHGNQIKFKAKWEGNDLVIAGQTQLNGAGVTLTDRWSLSADGKTLTIERHVMSPMGETDQKIVLERQ